MISFYKKLSLTWLLAGLLLSVLFLYFYSVQQSSKMVEEANAKLMHIATLNKELEDEYFSLYEKIDQAYSLLSKNMTHKRVSEEQLYESAHRIDKYIKDAGIKLLKPTNNNAYLLLESKIRFLIQINNQGEKEDFNDDLRLLEKDVSRLIHQYKTNLFSYFLTHHAHSVSKHLEPAHSESVNREISNIITITLSKFEQLEHNISIYFNQHKNYVDEVRQLIAKTDQITNDLVKNHRFREVTDYLNLTKLQTLQKQIRLLTLKFYSNYETMDFKSDSSIDLINQLASVWSEYEDFLVNEDHKINGLIEKESQKASRELQQKSNRLYNILFLGACLLVLFVVVFVLIAFYRLNGLRKMANIIAAGKEKPGLIESAQSNDFVSTVIHAFNHMIESLLLREKEVQQYVSELSSYGRNLEQEVMQRTQELFLRNKDLQNEITVRKQKEEKLLLSNMALSNTSEAIVITDRNLMIIEMNPAYCHIVGYSKEELIGKKPNCLDLGSQDNTLYQQMWQEINNKGSWSGELVNRSKSGKTFHIWQTINAVTNDKGEVTNYVAIFRDISKNKEVEKQLHSLAYYDHLTGLANRTLFYEYLEHELAVNRRTNKIIAVIFIDLDGFKYVNDSLGHQIGDLLLIEISKVLQSCIRESDIVARQGGDEFSVLLSGLEDIDYVPMVATKIINSLNAPFNIQDNSIEIGCSIGISMSPADAKDVDTLIKYSDTAMYSAKEKGKGRYEFFSHDLSEKNDRRTIILNRLNQAIEDKTFKIQLQPQINDKLEVVAAEALIRWQDKELGFVPPDEFIPIAEEIGKIHLIGHIVLEKVCQTIIQLQNTGLGLIPISINVSPKELTQPDFTDNLIKTLKHYDISHDSINIEVTETAFMENIQLAKKILIGLENLGFLLSLDDFGTGYSSLAYLHQIPFDHIKIDRSFIMNIPEEQSSISITKTILTFAHSVGMSVVAEGVETKTQLHFLLDHHCNYCQGYYISRPLPVDEFMVFIEQRDKTYLLS